jgi:hypothetical protein
MKVGVTGHRKRPGINWAWVKEQIVTEIRELPAPIEGFSSLAEGADQVFAEVVLECGGYLKAIIPTPDYEKHFNHAALKKYTSLKKRAETRELEPETSDEASFFNAGRYIADHTNLLLAIWDGKPAAGLGGTADVVKYALSQGTDVVHIDPLNYTVKRLSHGS